MARSKVRSKAFRAVNRAMGKAIHRFGMIGDGDRILVGLSGGKDSLTLLWFLQERLARIPIRYEFHCVYVDPGFEGGFAEELKAYCGANGHSLTVVFTDHGPLAHGPRNRENPCFLCSRLRRMVLFEKAEEMGCNAVALGHHKDDLIESFFLSIFYAGEIATMHPCQSYFGGKFKLIRPLAFAEQNDIRRFAAQEGLPEFRNPCPSAVSSRRSDVRGMLEEVYRQNRKVRGNIFRAICRGPLGTAPV